jgi:integrative and conjugative element protein (TIGR02256 family)
VIFNLKRSPFKRRIVGHLEGFSQELLVDLPVLKYVSRYRQVKSWSNEAGGQLFGTVDNDTVCVLEASGPYPGDERSRYRYRSNPVAAQYAIDKMAQRGLLYLGEWHTHAEDYPSASDLDNNAMRRLIENSRLNSNSLLLLIVGRVLCSDGLAVWSVANAKLHRWELQTLSK